MPDNENIRRIKNKTGNYSVILNDVFRHPGLSARAKGIYAYIMTLPDDWVLRKKELYTHFTEGRDSLDTAWKELEKLGYIIREFNRGIDGKITGSHYTVYESPQPAEQTVEQIPKTQPLSAEVNAQSEQIQPHFSRVTEKPIFGKTDFRENRKSVFPRLLSTDINQSLNLLNTAAAPNKIQPEPQKPPPDEKPVSIKSGVSEAAAANPNQNTPHANSPPEPAELKQRLRALNPALIFDVRFYTRAAVYLAANKLDSGFLSWLYELCKHKKPDSLSGYYFSVFFEPRYAELYRDYIRRKPPPTNAIISCPVCGKEHPRNAPCPVCGLSPDEHGNPEAIIRRKIIYQWPPDKREQYERELNALPYRPPGMDLDLYLKEYAKSLNAINQKYGI